MLKTKLLTKLNSFHWSVLKKTVLFCNRKKPYKRILRYKDFQLHYSQGTSIVEEHGIRPVIIGGIYEPIETEAILNLLAKHSEPVFLDIGANIGLMSLNVFSEYPNARIYSFEPGTHQYSLFQQTITSNQLEDSIYLYNVALSNKTGVATFASHESQHVSGDGFLDTGRAGKSSTVSVQTQTLDNWWKAKNCPLIHALKVDTEGSELWVLQGALAVIKACAPDIFIEINSKNLRPYPHNSDDVYYWLKENDYSLYDLEGNLVNTCEDINKRKGSDLFLAKKN